MKRPLKLVPFLYLAFSSCWVVLYLKLLLTGEFELYVNPVMKIFSWSLLLVFSFFILRLLLLPSLEFCRVFMWKYLVFLVPCFLILMTETGFLGAGAFERSRPGIEPASGKRGICLLNEDDIMNWATLLDDLKDSQEPGVKRVRSYLGRDTLLGVSNHRRNGRPAEKTRKLVLVDFNRILGDRSFFKPEFFVGAVHDADVPADRKMLSDEALQRLNRKALECAFGRSIKVRSAGEGRREQLPGSTRKPDYIALTGQEFTTCREMIQASPPELQGKVFLVKGIYFRDRDAPGEKQAQVGRLLIICCAAHAVPLGITVEFDTLPDAQNGEWIVVKGSLSMREARKGSIPLIRVDHWTRAEKESPYIYPALGAELPSLNIAGDRCRGKYEHLLPLVFTFFLVLVFIKTMVGDDLD